jgi:RNA polymerase sigma factor (sigma-70 family)
MSVSGTAATVDLTGRSDVRLVALVRAGENEAFEELYRRYEQRIRGFIANRVGDSARAEELTQDAFLSALRALRTSDAPIAWKPWLYEIARNATIDLHRRRRHAEELSVDHQELMRPLDRRRLVAARAPDAEFAAKETLDHLRGAFDELPPNHHQVLVLRELEGLSYSEIADRLNLTHAAVESKLFRARRRLEREFDELASGRRCVAARATVGLMAEGIDSRPERRRLARHARRCSACRRHARELGVDPFGRRQWQPRLGALLPLGWLLRRSGAAPARGGEALILGDGGHLGAGLAERTAALVAAGVLACAGSFSGLGANSHTPAAPRERAAASVVAPEPGVRSGAAGARLQARSAASEPRHTHQGERWRKRRHSKHTTRAPAGPATPLTPSRQGSQAPAGTASPRQTPVRGDGESPAAAALPSRAQAPTRAQDVLKPAKAVPQLPVRLRVLEALERSLHG